MAKGGIFGNFNDPTTSVMRGVWGTREQEWLKRSNLWPITTDEYFNYVSLLLGNNDINAAQNNTFLDDSINNFTITRNGNATQGTFSPYSLTGWSNYFDGTGDYLNLNGGTALTFGTGDFTIEFWVNPSQSANEYMMVDFRAANGAFPMIGHDSTRGVFYYLNSGYAITSNTILTPNAWYYICVARSGSSTKLFINGTQAGSTFTDSTNLSVGSNRPIIGTNGTNVGVLNLTGYISNLHVLKGTALYTSNFTPSTSPLTAIANTSLLTCQSNRFVDNSTNNFTLTRNGDVSVQSFSPFAPSIEYSVATVGGSMYFDGTGDYLNWSNSLFTFGTGDFTVEAWIYVTGSADFGIFGVGDASVGSYGLYWINSSSKFQSTRYGDTAGAGTTTNSYAKNQWIHVAAVRISGSARIYVNGVLDSGATYSMGSVTNSGVYTGAIWNSASGAGYISGLRVHTSNALYTSNFTPPETPLTATANTTLLLNGTNGGVIDYTGKNNLETVGNASTSTAVTKYQSKSIVFDGIDDVVKGKGNLVADFGTGDFTIEAWSYLTAAGDAYRYIYSLSYTATKAVQIRYGNTSFGQKLQVTLQSDSTAVVWSCALTQTSQLNKWYHIALTRQSGTCRLFVDGVLQNINSGANPSTYPVTSFTDTTNISGSSAYDQNIGFPNYIGYIDDVRVTKGIARYTANFTPPQAAFSRK